MSESITINDPISADIQAVAGAITEICKFLSTPEGQLLLKTSRENTAAFQANVAKTVDWFEKLFAKR